MKKNYWKYLTIIIFLSLFFFFVNNKLILRVCSPAQIIKSWYMKESVKNGYYPTLYPYNSLSTPTYKFYPPMPRIILSFFFLILENFHEFYLTKYVSLFMILLQSVTFYILGRTLFQEEKKAVIASIMILILPVNWLLLTIYGRVAATYAVPFLFLFLNFYLKYLRKSNKKNLILSTLLLSLSILTHAFISLEFLVLAGLYSLFYFKKKRFNVFLPLILGVGLCSFYLIQFFNMPAPFAITFDTKLNWKALFLPWINNTFKDKITYLSPLILLGGFIAGLKLFKEKGREFKPLVLWYAYLLFITLTREAILFIKLGWVVYLHVLSISSCLMFPALITNNKKVNYVIYVLIAIFVILNGVYIIKHSELVSPKYIRANDVSEFIPEYSYDNNLLTLPDLPNLKLLPYYSKINNIMPGLSWGGINENLLDNLIRFQNPNLKLEEFHSLLKKFNIRVLTLEKKTDAFGKGSEVYLQRVIKNYSNLTNRLLKEYPGEFTLLYEDDDIMVIRTNWNNSFVTGGSYEVIRPERIRLFPENNTMLVKLNYLNNWQVSDGSVEQTESGFMTVRTNSTNPIMLEFLPNKVDYLGIGISLITLCFFITFIKLFNFSD